MIRMTISSNPVVGDGFITLGCTVFETREAHILWELHTISGLGVSKCKCQDGPFFRVLWSPVPKQRKQVREEFSRGIDTRCSSQFAQNATAQRMPKKV